MRKKGYRPLSPSKAAPSPARARGGGGVDPIGDLAGDLEESEGGGGGGGDGGYKGSVPEQSFGEFAGEEDLDAAADAAPPPPAPAAGAKAAAAASPAARAESDEAAALKPGKTWSGDLRRFVACFSPLAFKTPEAEAARKVREREREFSRYPRHTPSSRRPPPRSARAPISSDGLQVGGPQRQRALLPG